MIILSFVNLKSPNIKSDLIQHFEALSTPDFKTIKAIHFSW